MLSAFHALVLGAVQGATEFLPVSSSGHLILVPALLGWPAPGLAFDASIHLGTTAALLCYFGPELMRLLAGCRDGRPAERRLVVALAVGTLPGVAAAVIFEDVIATRLHSVTVVALASIGWGVVLWWADRQAGQAQIRDVDGVGIARGLAIGGAQALALVPGTSRSGITLSAGLFTGLDRPTAARFAFLLGLPITAAAAVVKTAELLRGGLAATEQLALAVGIGTSFVTGLAAVWFLVGYLRRRTLTVFVVYRIALGLVLLAVGPGPA